MTKSLINSFFDLYNQMKEMIKKYDKIILPVLFVYALFINPISQISIFSYFDELFTFIFAFYCLMNVKEVFRYKRIICYAWILFLVIGLISSIIFQYQGIFAVLMDSFAINSKFIIVYLACYLYFIKNKANVKNEIINCAKVIIIVLAFITVHDLIFNPIFPKAEFRYFMYSYRLMFSHPTYLAAAMSTLLILFGFDNKDNKNIAYMIIASIIGVFTFRLKAVAFIAFYWIVYIVVFILKKEKLLIQTIIVGVISSFVIAKDAIEGYFLVSAGKFSPRSIMLNDSIKLASNHFPLGTGFGSFGTTIADKFYSPLYYELGYQNFWGMGPENSMFLTDCFWPAVIAQTGYVGLIIFATVLLNLLMYCFKTFKINKMNGLSMLMILAYLCITSTAESSFFNPTSFLFFMLFALFEVDSILNN